MIDEPWEGKEVIKVAEQPMLIVLSIINVKDCKCQLEVCLPSRAGKEEQMWLGGEAGMAGQRGLPMAGRTCSYSREVAVCPTVYYKPLRQLSSLALGLWRREHQTGGYIP